MHTELLPTCSRLTRVAALATALAGCHPDAGLGRDEDAGRDAAAPTPDATPPIADGGSTPDSAVAPDSARGPDDAALLDAAPPPDASAPDASAPDASAADDGPTSGAHTGLIAVTTWQGTDGRSYSQGTAGFSDTTFGGRCTRRSAGACVVDDCPAGGSGDVSVFVSAGNVTITSDTPPAIPLLPGMILGRLQYSVYSDTVRRWTAGETVRFSAAGATVPAFSGSVVFPSDMTVTAPAPLGGRIALDRATDLALRWTSLAHGSARAAIFQNNGPDGASVTINCDYPGADGAGVIPVAVLSALSTSALTTQFQLDAAEIQRVTAGTYEISLMAHRGGLTAQVDVH